MENEPPNSWATEVNQLVEKYEMANLSNYGEAMMK